TRLRVRLSFKERRMRFANATNINRKSGGAKPDFLLHHSDRRLRMWFSPKENHMQLTEAATLDRKSGGAEDLQFRGRLLEMFCDRAGST
ncbi:MAG: hypothetical protein WCD57_12300, partial [Acidobacteriaceae bacterium]